jgi:hypothetical protein
MNDPIQAILAKLPDANPTIDDRRWTACCPAHHDRRPSLSIARGSDGRALLKCHAGCDIEAIVKALGLTMHDLFPSANGVALPTRAGGAPRQHHPATPYATAEAAVAALEQRHGMCSALWTYDDAAGEPVGVIGRWDLTNEKGEPVKEFRPVSRVADGWRIGAMPQPRPLYKLPYLLRGEGRVVVCEGEKAADAGQGIGLLATTSAHGAQAAAKADWTPLAGRDVVILPDNDAPGRKYAADVAAILRGLTPPAAVKIIELPGLPESGDLVEYVQAQQAAGLDAAEILAEIDRLAAAGEEETAGAKATVAGRTGENKGGASRRGRPRQADVLVEMALANGVGLFHTPGGCDSEGYVTIPANDHTENWPIGSKVFRRWLSRLLWQGHRKTPSAQAVQDAINVLAGMALHEGAEHTVAVRVAEHGGVIYLDLANDAWQTVEITRDGWHVTSSPPVKFIRRRGMFALPTPVRGGSIDELRPLVNIPDDDAWMLYVAWLVAAHRPGRPFPVLCVNGEQGSAKSTAVRMARRLIDPSKSDVRRPPRDERDLMIAANNSWVVAYDNLSSLPRWLSDAICTLATGGGLSTRELYTDDDEKLFDAVRPVMLNGIPDVATEGDLLDRGLALTLPQIPDDRRRDENELWSHFEQVRPRVQGALLDAVSAALLHRPGVRLASKPRMADFASWVVAAEPALPWGRGAFLAAYTANRRATNALALESSIIAPPILSLMAQRRSWHGTVAELLAALEAPHADDKVVKRKEWPNSPRGLSGELRRLAPNLRRSGIEVKIGRHTRKGTLVTIEKAGEAPSPSSPPAPDRPGKDLRGDDRMTVENGGDGRPDPPSCRNPLAHKVGDGGDRGDDVPHTQSDPDEGAWGEV